ncbi:MAG: hypothetical protein K9N55_11490 [Phycisphaerae bacterium]|nr:hypothetical protein [Phycisphaerae bacterium]
MSLVRWLRKNNKKLMAVFVILIMISFLGVGQMMRYASRQSGQKTVAFYGKNKITDRELAEAREELELLQALQAQSFLQSSDMRGLFLGEILFSERSINPRILSFLNQSIQQNGLGITPEQITRLYQGTSAPNVYWFLLKKEARQAGMAIDNKTIRMLLNQVASELFNGQTYKQLMQQTMQRFSMSEAEILETYGSLLSVLQFSRMATQMDDVTTSQIKHMASWTKETLSTESVKLEAADFLKLEDPNAVPAESVLTAHFNQYKGIEPGTLSDDNPYGLGYKLPNQIQLEYMVVQLDDVKKTINKPSAQDLEDYYQRVASSVFTRQVSADPNMDDDDPNAPKKDIVLSYAEVASEVEKRLIVDKTIQKTSDILQQARPLVQIPLSEEEAKAKGPEALASIVDANYPFSKAAETLKISYPSVPVYMGTTGLLSQSDMGSDPYLRRLVASGSGNTMARLVDVLFTVEPLKSSDPSLMSMSKPWLFNTLGPIKDQGTRPGTSVTGQIMALIRIVAVKPSTEPASLADVYNKTGIILDADQEPKQVVLKDTIVKDVKTLQVYESLKGKAQELLDLVAAGSWDSAVNQFNSQYGAKIKANPADPNLFSVQPRPLRRAPDSQIAQMAGMAKMNPMILSYVNSIRADNQLFDTLYKMIPADKDKADNLPVAVASPADYSVYCIKDLSVSRLSQQEYEKAKAEMIIRETQIAAQSIAIVHFTPDNILSRMSFKWKDVKPDDITDANDSKD